METHIDRPSLRLRGLLGAALVLVASGCVSQTQYKEALAEVRYYQRALQDLESFHGTCEAKIALLEGELAIHEGQPIEAGMTQEIDAKIDDLGRIMESLGKPGDVSILAVEGGYGMSLSNAVLFASGSSELTDEGKKLLVEMAGQILERPFERIWVRGHTDSDPIVRAETLARYPNGNLQLSSARAIEVAALLGAEGGIARDQLVVAGFGASNPVVPNDSAANKALNRRVEIFVIEETPSVSGEG